MRVTPVESSMIYAVGYDPKTRELEIFFQSGRVYRYVDVDKKDYDGLLNAESKGTYMNSYIIGVYKYYQVK